MTNLEIDNRMYSDWSAWSKCSHHCFRSTKARRRNCLHDQCNGVLEEKVACVNPTCAKFSEIKRLAGIRANETAKKLSVDLLHLKGSQVFNDVIKAGEAFTLASKQIQQQENISTAIPKDPFKMFANYATVQISNEEKEGKTAVKTSEKNTTELKTAAASEATPSSAADLAASNLLENLFNTSVADDTAKISPKEALEPVTPGNLVPSANATTEGSIEKPTEGKNPEDVIVDKLISHFTQRILDDSVRSATNGLNEDIKAEAAASKGEDTEETAENDDESTTIANLLSQKLANTSMGLLEGEKSDPVWGEWSSCSITCGQGHATRNLICAANQCNDIILRTQLKPCNMGSCQDNKKDDLQGSCLSLHNEYRRRHGAATLEWSDELYRKATEIANRISINNIPGQNLSIYERPGLNLAYMSLGDVAPQTSACSRAIDKWYLQKMFYNYDAPKLTPEDHDFTQLVWKSSRRVGLARMNSLGNDAVYVAAVYEPAGNVDQETEMRKNVMAVPTGPDVDILKDLFSSAKKSKVLRNIN